MSLLRLHSPSAEEFLDQCLRPARPAVITGAMVPWQLDQQWTPQALRARLGSEQVALFNDYFDFQRLMSLSRYLDQYFDRLTPPPRMPYVRWYSKMRSVRFAWADEVFAKLQDCWHAPAFLPSADYRLPATASDQFLDPVRHRFPARGLFISGQGGRTGLHRDPWGSDAVLCLTFGVKRWTFYSPDQAALLADEAQVCDIDQPDLERFPRAREAQAFEVFDQRAGDIVYVPRGWLHAVRNETDTVAVTWNFVHAAGAEAFEAWREGPKSAIDEDVLDYFTSGASFID